MITTFKKIILSLDVVFEIGIVFGLLISYFLSKMESAAVNLYILLLAGMYNLISTLVNLLAKSDSKKIRTFRLSYLATIFICFGLAYVFITPNSSTQSIFFENYIHILILNSFAFGYAILTFLDFRSILIIYLNKRK